MFQFEYFTVLLICLETSSWLLEQRTSSIINQNKTPPYWDPRNKHNGLKDEAATTTPKVIIFTNSSMISNESPKSPYFSDWSRLVSGYGSQQCYRIPKEMTLCNGIGYELMVLPNSLEHEDMKEVVAQSEVWLTLVNLGCHGELQRFLCSLYAPVCIKGHHEELIQPCRDLCESVRGSCLPILSEFGLGWPDILKCSKFPIGPSELCIPANKQKKARCSGCVKNPKYESGIGSYCTSDVVIRANVLEAKSVINGTNESLTLKLGYRIKVFKMLGQINAPSNLVYNLDCDCPIIKAATTQPKGSGRWLLMGKLSADGKSVQIHHLSKISNRNVGIKQALRQIRWNSPSLCQVNLHPSTMHTGMARSTKDTRQRKAPLNRQSLANAQNRHRNRNRRRKRQKRKRPDNIDNINRSPATVTTSQMKLKQ